MSDTAFLAEALLETIQRLVSEIGRDQTIRLLGLDRDYSSPNQSVYPRNLSEEDDLESTILKCNFLERILKEMLDEEE